jgi:DNA-binding GntR family transcriptional regulator
MAGSTPRARTKTTSPPAATPGESPYERIKAAILAGELEPGQALVELSLAEWCQVSRTPIREALGRLQQDGLVERGERGWMVRETSPEQILDIYETRIPLEATAARMAAERRTSHDLMAMRRLAARMSDPEPAELSEKAALSAQFHQALWRASHNESLIDILERLSMHLGRYPATTLAYPGRWDTAIAEHDQIITAISNRDADLAERLATEHYTGARDIRLVLWEQE